MWHVRGQERGCVVVKPEGQGSLRKPRSTQENYTEMDLEGVG